MLRRNPHVFILLSFEVLGVLRRNPRCSLDFEELGVLRRNPNELVDGQLTHQDVLRSRKELRGVRSCAPPLVGSSAASADSEPRPGVGLPNGFRQNFSDS